MKKSKELAKAMGITYLEYENCRDTHFGLWCNHYSVQHAVPLRTLQTNDHLFNWFCDMWLRHVELPFYMQIMPYLEAGIEDPQTVQDLFMEHTDAIKGFYPKPLLNTIKKQFKERLAHG